MAWRWTRWYTSPVYGQGHPIKTAHLPATATVSEGRVRITRVTMLCGKVAEGGGYPSESAPRCKRCEEIAAKREVR